MSEEHTASVLSPEDGGSIFLRNILSTPRTRTEMVLETLVFSLFNHLTRLVTREDFIIHSRRESSRSYFLRNVGIYLQVQTASLPRRLTCTSSLLWEPQILYECTDEVKMVLLCFCYSAYRVSQKISSPKLLVPKTGLPLTIQLLSYGSQCHRVVILHRYRLQAGTTVSNRSFLW
jgi:hypothetical protein